MRDQFRWSLRHWFRATFYIGLLLTVTLHGNLFIDHSRYHSRFLFRLYDTSVLELVRGRTTVLDTKTGTYRYNGYIIFVGFADRQILSTQIGRTWT